MTERYDRALPAGGARQTASRRRFLGGAAGAAAALGVVGAVASKAAPARAATGQPIYINVTDPPYNADPTGQTDSAPAIQAAINAASAPFETAGGQPEGITITSTVYVPSGSYLIKSPLALQAVPGSGSATKPALGIPIRFTGDGPGSWIHSSAASPCGIIDFGTTAGTPGPNYLAGVEIDHLTLDATGGHVFVNSDIHRSSFHDLQLVQRSGDYSIWNMGTGNGLSVTHFDRISSYAYCFPPTGTNPASLANTRTVPAWSIISPVNETIDVVHFSQCSNFNMPYASGGPVDNRQFFFDLQCTVTAAGKLGQMDRIYFTQCDFNMPMGGAIRVLSCSGLVLDQIGAGNLAATPHTGQTTAVRTRTAMIWVDGHSTSDSPDDAPEETVISNYVREGGGNIGAGTTQADIYIGDACHNTTVIAPCVVGLPSKKNAIQINLNNSSGAVIISPQTGYSLQAGKDATIVGS